MILGDLIKEYRQEHSCSMDQFAKLSGLSKAYVSILERNVNPVNGKPVIPSLETIKAVSQAINMDFNDVIAMLDGDQPVILNSESSTSAHTPYSFLLAALQKSKEDDQTRISEMIEDFQKLNEEGKCKAVERVHELTEIQRYQNLCSEAFDSFREKHLSTNREALPTTVKDQNA